MPHFMVAYCPQIYHFGNYPTHNLTPFVCCKLLFFIITVTVSISLL